MLCGLLLALTLVGCYGVTSPSVSTNGDGHSNEITVSAAVSLKDAFNEIGKLYESRKGTKINFNFGASGVLQQQIENAAPVDVFASAGAKQMDALQAVGLIMPESRRDFARNSLVLIAPLNPSVEIKSFGELVNANITRVAIGNPKTVPAGQYTEELLVNMKLWDKLQSKIVTAGDVRQVLDYVIRGEVDAGIVYASDAWVAGNQVRILERAPADLHSPILYPLAVIKDSRRKQEAERFTELVLSAEGQSILNKYGFVAVR